MSPMGGEVIGGHGGDEVYFGVEFEKGLGAGGVCGDGDCLAAAGGGHVLSGGFGGEEDGGDPAA